MKSRIRRVAILSAFVALALFLVPLGYAIVSLTMAEARAGLDASALHAALTIDPTFSGSDQTELPKPPAGQELALYGANGKLVVGTGPKQADSAVVAALNGRSAPGIVNGSLVVVVPTASAEAITGAVRASVPVGSVWGRVLALWGIMILVAAIALFIGVAVARSLSRRIVAPMEALARASRSLGDGDFTVRTNPTGLPEIDAAGSALNITAQRLNEAMTRERKLTSNASHQLRTPLTGLRAMLENALDDPEADLRRTLSSAIESADSLEATIDEIIKLGRGESPGLPIDVTRPAEEAVRRWNGALASVGRPIYLALETEEPFAIASEASLRQLFDILLENSFRHGHGDVVVRIRGAHGAVAVDVEDAGDSIAIGFDVFADGFSTDGGSGLGLTLAQQLVSDHGGQLLLTSRSPRTRFTAVLIASDPVLEEGDSGSSASRH